MRTLIVAHVYYPQLWPELAARIRNVTGACDTIVTYGDGSAVSAARRDFPEATFLACENVGYDVWPFVKALKAVDLSRYDVVVKLHTKRDIPTPYCANNAYLGGPVWRERLLGFVKSPQAWRKTCARLAEPGIGMVADRRLVYTGNVTEPDCGVFDRALAEAERLTGVSQEGGRFVAGSMFAVRADVLRPLANAPYSGSSFDRPEAGNYLTPAHVLERVFGLLVSAAGLCVEGFNGSVDRRNAFYAERGFWNRLARFFFWRRYVDGEVKVKICRIQVRHRKLKV